MILTGAQPQPARVLQEAGICPEDSHLANCPTVEAAVALARELRERAPVSVEIA